MTSLSDAPDPRAVMSAFGLTGAPTSCVEVSGGWSNRVFRLDTTAGTFAVKELRNAWGEPRWREWVDEGWRLEQAALAVGIRAPRPVPERDSGGCVAYVETAGGGGQLPVRLHQWVDAAILAREPVATDVATWAGATLATLHALALQPTTPDLYAGRTGLTSADVWPELVRRSRAAAAPWSEELEAAEPWARRVGALLDGDGDGDGEGTVLSHGDVDQKNLLLADDGPLLIDWDVVLPVVPRHDVVHAALDLASWRAPGVAGALLQGYRDAGGADHRPVATDLGPALASRLGWIRFTVDRALEARASGTPQPDAASIPTLLADLERRVTLAESIDTWLG